MYELLFSYSVMFDSYVTLWTAARQAPLSMGFSRQEYWAGLPFPSPGDFPDPGIEPRSPTLASGFFTAEPAGKLECMDGLRQICLSPSLVAVFF